MREADMKEDFCMHDLKPAGIEEFICGKCGRFFNLSDKEESIEGFGYRLTYSEMEMIRKTLRLQTITNLALAAVFGIFLAVLAVLLANFDINNFLSRAVIALEAMAG